MRTVRPTLFACFVKFAGEINVDDPAADREIAGHFDLFQPVVAVIGQPDDQLFGFEFVARL